MELIKATFPGQDNLGIQTIELAEAVRIKPSQMLHRKAKIVPQELIDQAIANNPLETLPRWKFTDEMNASSTFRQALPDLKSSFLNTHFLMFADMGITFETSTDEITKLIAKTVGEKPTLGEFYAATQTSFTVFQKLFSFIEFIASKGRFEEKHLTSLHSICTAYGSIADHVRRAKLMKPIGLQIEFNRERYIFEIPTVLSTSNLPEILLAMPVCFLGKTQGTEKDEDPVISEEVKMICNTVGSKSFAWFYQMYNRRDRKIADFRGPDPIPTDYLEFSPQLANLVDLEVIATPYHEIASQEWADPAWRSSIDPIAFCLFKELPFLIIFKRWSGNGIFPLLADLIADTITHINTHKNFLSKFKETTFWYKGNGGIINSSNIYLGDPEHLKTFAEKLVLEFKQGKVFDFLRG